MLVPNPRCKVSMGKFSEACDKFVLTVSIKKTEVMYQPAPRTPYHDPTITVKGQKLQAVELGSTLSRAVNIDVEVNNRLAKASSAFEVYPAVMLTTLLFVCESRTVYQRYARQPNHFNMTCFRPVAY